MADKIDTQKIASLIVAAIGVIAMYIGIYHFFGFYGALIFFGFTLRGKYFFIGK